MSSDEEIIISGDDNDIEYVEDTKQNLSKGLNSCSKFNSENLNTALFNKYINISHETLQVNRLAMQSNLIAMQNSQLAMKNLQDLTESIMKQINFNSIDLKDEAKSEVSTSKDESGKEFECSHCQLKFKLNYTLIRHMESFHGPEEINDRAFIKEPEFNFPTVSNAKNEDNTKDNNSNNDTNNNNNITNNDDDDDDICVINAEHKNYDVSPSNQHKENIDKKCSVILSRISCVNNDKQCHMKKKRESTEDPNLLNSSINKNIRFLTRDVTHENIRVRKNQRSKVLGYVKTLCINKPMRFP
ncbi:uncharacterized protein LOC141531792 isoform X1 [Cotesia typhae]|uniref:uncharacterized protein LOC141531792 isoform X1 n=1 Tax=Cotesia typhae TaxID=2053667 RepID=UPI003D68F167